HFPELVDSLRLRHRRLRLLLGHGRRKPGLRGHGSCPPRSTPLAEPRMVLDQFKLDGKVAIVTGASRGLGRAMAIALAEAGANVALVASTSTAQTAAAIHPLGRKTAQVQADLLRNESVSQIVERTMKELGRVDILVNNAGIIRRATVLDFT